MKQIPINDKYPYLLIKSVGSSYSPNITYEPATSISDGYRRMMETKNLKQCLICKIEERYKADEVINDKTTNA